MIPTSWTRDGKLIRAGKPGEELLVLVVPCPPARGFLPASACVRKHDSGTFDACGGCELGKRRGGKAVWRPAVVDVEGERRKGLVFANAGASSRSPEVKAKREAAAAARRAKLGAPTPTPAKARQRRPRPAKAPGVRSKVPGGAAWLRKARAEAGLTLMEVATRLGWKTSSCTQLQKIEAGKARLTLGMRDRLARALCIAT